MENALENRELVKENLLDGQGFVRVITVSPETYPEGRTPEYLIAKAARASYGSDNKSANADKRLIEFLVRHQHTSPLEMCSITFCMKLPIAICRQLLRHRTGKFNEFSQRYSEVTEEVNRFRLKGYDACMRGQSSANQQASDFNLSIEQIEKIDNTTKKIERLQDEIFLLYRELLETGQARELARFHLPLSTYTTIYVQFDLNNLMKFLKLRCAPDAQYEIRVYAEAMKELASQFFPICLNIHSQYESGILVGELEKKMIAEGRIPDEIESRTHRDYLTRVASELNLHLRSS